MSAEEQVRRAFVQRVAGYVGLGWTIAERQEHPLRVRLVYRSKRRGRTPWSNEVRDTGERVVWVDETGEVRVEQVSSP